MKPKGKPVVLSIDDDANFRNAIELVLGRLGLLVKSVSNRMEFMDQATQLNPDLYLIDLQLGEQDGIELIKEIRQSARPDAAIVVISGKKSPEAVTHALERGANDFLLKPLDRVLLATKLAQFVDTDEIREHRADWQELSEGRAQAKLEFDGKILEIDELGIKFAGPTLTPKGTVLRVGSEVFGKIGMKDQSCLVTVVSTWLIPKSPLYGAYAEFDGVDPEFLQMVRAWLSLP